MSRRKRLWAKTLAVGLGVAIAALAFSIVPTGAAPDTEALIVNNNVASVWTNPTNTQADDGNCASHTSSNRNQDDNFTSPAFSIPSGATINGFEVKVDHGENDGNDYMQLALNSTAGWTAYKNTPNNNAGSCAGVTEYTAGGSTDDWGGTWTVAHINSSSFQVRIRSKATAAGGGGWWADYVEVTVHFTPAPAAPDVLFGQWMATLPVLRQESQTRQIPIGAGAPR